MPHVHTVASGDCISSIAFVYGFFPDTLWQHADNSALKQQRANPHSLLPGDKVHVPDLRQRQLDCAAEQKHRFRRKGVPAKFRVRLMTDDQPRKNVKFVFECGSIRKQGTSDGNGFIEAEIPPYEAIATLRVGEGETQEVYELELGHVPPLDTEPGAAARLGNLGYSLDDGLAPALQAFQQANGLTVNGTLDAATKDKLKAAYGH